MAMRQPLPGRAQKRASVNPATAFLDAGRGLISGVHDHTGLAFACARMAEGGQGSIEGPSVDFGGRLYGGQYAP